jgi:hypothetical protein
MSWVARRIIFPSAVVLLLVALAVVHIGSGRCMRRCAAAGYRSYIYYFPRQGMAKCECVNPAKKPALALTFVGADAP